ncbi:MAG: hypothetical protein AB8B72_09175 [Crocinitomicaceae bacterium]
MKFSFLSILLGTIIGMTSSSCRKLSKYSDPSLIAPSSWDPQLAAPIAHATFGVYDILAATDSSDIVVIDPNSGEIALVYKGEVVSVVAEDIFSLPVISEQISFSMADINLPAAPSFNGSLSQQATFNNNFAVANGVEFHTVNFKGGSVEVNFTSDLKHDINITVSFPYMIKNGNPLTATLQGVYSTGPVVASATIDLTDVTGNFTDAGSTVNTVVMSVRTEVNGTGEEVNGSESIVLDAVVINPAYRNATGYFGQQSLGSYSDSVLIKIFSTATNGYFELTNPKVRLELINSFGFPVEVALNNLKSINLNTGTTLPLSGYPSPVNILAPTILGDSKTTVIELNNTNTTNISSIISPSPKYFYFEAEGTANPSGPGANLNFIQDTSRFKINAELELPMEGFAYGFYVQDTVEFGFQEDISQIESVSFRLKVDNGFPIDIDADIVFVDENYQPLFSLTDGFKLVVASGTTNTNGEVVSITEKITDFSANSSQLPLLEQAKHVIIKANMETLNGTENEVIKILDSYTIAVRLGMNVKLNINLQ